MTNELTAPEPAGRDARLINGLEPLLERFDVFVLDQWGVLHEGNQLYPGVIPFLEEAHRRDKDVIVLTNSSKSSARNVERLEARFGLPRGSYQALVSSADLVLAWARGAADEIVLPPPRAVFIVADEGDEQLLISADVETVPDVEQADAVALLSLPVEDSLEDHRAWLETAAHMQLPLVCPSADIHTVRPHGVFSGMAAAIRHYAELGGEVHNVGKPSSPIYARCRRFMRVADPSRIVMVGDQIASDIVGAKSQGWSTVLVETGAGRHALASSEIRPEYLLEELRL